MNRRDGLERRDWLDRRVLNTITRVYPTERRVPGIIQERRGVDCGPAHELIGNEWYAGDDRRKAREDTARRHLRMTWLYGGTS